MNDSRWHTFEWKNWRICMNVDVVFLKYASVGGRCWEMRCRFIVFPLLFEQRKFYAAKLRERENIPNLILLYTFLVFKLNWLLLPDSMRFYLIHRQTDSICSTVECICISKSDLYEFCSHKMNYVAAQRKNMSIDICHHSTICHWNFYETIRYKYAFWFVRTQI